MARATEGFSARTATGSGGISNQGSRIGERRRFYAISRRPVSLEGDSRESAAIGREGIPAAGLPEEGNGGRAGAASAPLIETRTSKEISMLSLGCGRRTEPGQPGP